MTQRLLMVAGEASGDLHGGNLARALHGQQPTLQLLGVGGRHMRLAGVELLFDIRDLAVVGAVEAVRSLRTLWTVYHRLLAEVERTPVDAVVLIDFPGFNLRLAKALAQRHIPVLYYIAPQVWAWHPGRLKKIRQWVRQLFVILPFEAALYHDVGVKAEFVGHPLLDLVPSSGAKADARIACGLDPTAPVVGILPGSRRSELHYLLRPMLEAAAQIYTQMPTVQFILPLAETLTADGCPASARIHDDIVCSWCNVRPMRPCRRPTFFWWLQELPRSKPRSSGRLWSLSTKHTCSPTLLARLVMRVSRIGLPNIIARRAIVPELWQYEVTV